MLVHTRYDHELSSQVTESYRDKRKLNPALKITLELISYFPASNISFGWSKIHSQSVIPKHLPCHDPAPVWPRSSVGRLTVI